MPASTAAAAAQGAMGEAEPDSQLAAIAAAFRLPGPVCGLEPLGNGNVNSTHRLLCAAEPPRAFVLQKLNRAVFPRPELVIANMIAIGEHVEARLQRGCELLGECRWELPRIVPARDGTRPWVERDGGFWRLITFVENSHSLEVVREGQQAREVGFALGVFHHLISDLDPARLADTLEGFHVTPRYLEQYDAMEAGAPVAGAAENGAAEPGRSGAAGSDLRHGRAFIAARRGFTPVLEAARASGLLQLRPIHGDPKVNNVMLDDATGRAVALVDLDTVKPGLVQYDIGDCLRSCCNPLGEETSELQAVQFDVDLCREVLGGYLAAASGFLTPADYDHLYDAIRLISFELGLRFFTDHLAGDVYFRTDRPDHNLQRALVQFRLTESIEARERQIRAVIADLRVEAARCR